MIPFGTHKVGHFQFPGAGGSSDDHMAEQWAKHHVAAVLVDEFIDNFGTAGRIGCVILEHNLNRAAIDAACIIDHLQGRGGRALIPVAVGRPDTRAVQLKAQLDRGRLRKNRP